AFLSPCPVCFVLLHRKGRCIMDFFFQAEDGIRDFHVTGVQTCALPICTTSAATSAHTTGTIVICRSILWWARWCFGLNCAPATEIGRASCRERAFISEDSVSVTKIIETNTSVNSRRVKQSGLPPHRAGR